MIPRLKLIKGHRLVLCFRLDSPTLVFVSKRGNGFASNQAENVQELTESLWNPEGWEFGPIYTNIIYYHFFRFKDYKNLKNDSSLWIHYKYVCVLPHNKMVIHTHTHTQSHT